MKRQFFEAEYAFNPVGQGLFSTGVLGRSLETAPAYIWVYDCGTASKRALLDREIDLLERTVDGCRPTQPYLDLVVVSHFDHDHISGLVTLLKKFKVRDLMLPYMPLWQRMAIALIEGAVAGSHLMRFLTNPAEYILSLRDVQVERILFASPGGQARGPSQFAQGEGPRPRTPEPEADQPLGQLPRWSVSVETTELPEDDHDETACAEIARMKAAKKRTSIEYMVKGASLTVVDVWEFVPYNDAELAPLATKAFRTMVSRLRGDLLNAKDDKGREAALKALKDEYDRTFKKTSERRNLISLFLYAAPVVAASLSALQHMSCTGKGHQFNEHFMNRHTFGGVLYTGDGYVDTPARFRALRSYLSDRRISRVDVLQVMHHGSSNNWYPSVATQFSPIFSVFSSDPKRKRTAHPHQEVLRDFWEFGPMQADGNTRAAFSVVFGWSK